MFGFHQEFLSLSGGINITVDALKKLIAEANERIDTELLTFGTFVKDVHGNIFRS